MAENSLRSFFQSIRRMPWPGRVALLGFAVLAPAYALFLPSFEGPDESEHSRYVQAWMTGAKIEAPVPGQPPNWGYQIIQPPLYYWLLGNYAKIVRPEFHTTLTINRKQNPRFPFIRHDLPGERFPWTAEHFGLRLLRLPSVLIGLLTALVMLKLGTILFPKDTWAQSLFLILGLLPPNILHLFAIVNNECLTLPLSIGAITLAVVITRRETLSLPLFGICGVVLALNLITKLTAFIPIMTVASLLCIDMIVNRRWAYYLRGVPLMATPLLLGGGAYVIANYMQYADPLRQDMLEVVAPTFYQEIPFPTTVILAALFRDFPGEFLADLCWKSCKASMPGRLLFWIWSLTLLAWPATLIRRNYRHRRVHTEHLLPILATLWSVIFALLSYRHWEAPALRHLLSVWSVAMLSIVYVAAALSMSWRRWIVYGTLAGLLGLNAWMLVNLEVFYQGRADPDLDRDYHTFLYAYCDNRDRGSSFAVHGNYISYDVQAAFSHADWQRVNELIEDVPPQTILSTQSAFLYAVSLSMSDRAADSLAVCKKIAPDYPEAQPLQVKLTLLKGDYATAEQLLQNYLPSSGGDVREQLERLQAELQTTAGSNFE